MSDTAAPIETPQLLLDHHLKALRLPTMLREYDHVARQCAAEDLDYPRYLLRMAELELLDRERRATERRIRQAKFPITKSLDSFDFLVIPTLDKAMVLELARCESLPRRENVLLLGSSGIGKTHIALALGLAACQQGYRVRFTTAAALVHELIEARDERKLLRFQKQIASYELLIVDELGFVPLSKTGAELLFEMLARVSGVEQNTLDLLLDAISRATPTRAKDQQGRQQASSKFAGPVCAVSSGQILSRQQSETMGPKACFQGRKNGKKRAITVRNDIWAYESVALLRCGVYYDRTLIRPVDVFAANVLFKRPNRRQSMIDLHSHTTASDGSLSPEALVNLGCASGLKALAITDHDTFAGFDQALGHARGQGLDLVCGIELSTRYRNRSVHLLGYFPAGKPGPEFTDWIAGLRRSRNARNLELARKLKARGVDIPIDNLLERHGDMLGRPHFGAAMVENGFAASLQQAFDEYLAESGSCFVQREEPSLANAAQRIAQAGGLASLAHPCRVSTDATELAELLADMRQHGLAAIEVYHSDHSPAQVTSYSKLAQDFDLVVTGGSDFHGTTKPGIELGTGRRGNLEIPASVLSNIRRSVRNTHRS